MSTDFIKHYKNYYADADSEWRALGAVDKANNIQTLCENLSIKSVVEIGAGEGSVLKKLSELNFAKEYYALEISPTGAETIKNKNIPQLQECLLFDGYNIPFNSKKFDLAVLSHVVEHVEHPRILLNEVARIAKYIFIEVPLEDTIRLPQDFVMDSVGHINFYSPKTIRRLIQSCNIKVLDQQSTNPSKEIYTFHKGKTGLINFFTKKYLLQFFPKLATKLFVYHSAILCEENK